MQITDKMSLTDLAQRIGQDATEEQAAIMRDALTATEYETTEEVPDGEWADMIAALL